MAASNITGGGSSSLSLRTSDTAVVEIDSKKVGAVFILLLGIDLSLFLTSGSRLSAPSLFSGFNMLLSWATNCHQHVQRLSSGLRLSRCYVFSLKLTCTAYCIPGDWLLYRGNPCLPMREPTKKYENVVLFFWIREMPLILWHIMSASSPMHPGRAEWYWIGVHWLCRF